jgi:hypothetical protein
VFKVLIHLDVVEDLLFYHHPRHELIADGKAPWRKFHCILGNLMGMVSLLTLSPLQDSVALLTLHAVVGMMMMKMREVVLDVRVEVSSAGCLIGLIVVAIARVDLLIATGAMEGLRGKLLMPET